MHVLWIGNLSACEEQVSSRLFESDITVNVDDSPMSMLIWAQYMRLMSKVPLPGNYSPVVQSWVKSIQSRVMHLRQGT
jgi:hypothetical protein